MKVLYAASAGSGNVAQFAAEKVIHLGGKVVTMSDSSGWIHDPVGIDQEKLDWIMDLKNIHAVELVNMQSISGQYLQNLNLSQHQWTMGCKRRCCPPLCYSK